jgi:HSP20 family protein
MSFFNVTPSQENKPVNSSNEPTATATRARQLTLPVDIYEGESELLLLADLPGVGPEGLNVSFESPELRIEGTRGTGEGADVYSRTFRVSEQIDPSGITAELSAGVLKLRLAKAAHTKPRKIEVRAG